MARDIEDHSAAARRFCEEVARTGTVWALELDGEIAGCPSFDAPGKLACPFYSDRALASHGARKWGAEHFQLCPIRLDEFLGQTLPGMARRDQLAGLDWDRHMCGPEWVPGRVRDGIVPLLATGTDRHTAALTRACA